MSGLESADYFETRNDAPKDAAHPSKNIRHKFNTACTNAKPPDVTPHTLRHTSVSWMVHAGTLIEMVSRFLGHNDVQTTWRIYSHHAPDYSAEAARALDRGDVTAHVTAQGVLE